MITLTKRIAALFTALALAFLFAVPADCTHIGSEIITGEFSFLPASGNTVLSDTFHYSDSYFSVPADEPNVHLRTMSLCLALTAFGTFSGDNSAYTNEILLKTGFSDVTADDMNEATSENTIGTVIAHKKTAYGEVTAVAIRGGYYGREWGNTLDIGASGDAAGLTAAAKKVAERIKEYESANGLGGSKLWITGYSRAGAVADLAGKYVNEHPDEFGISPDSAYIYTFEAPAASVTASGHSNIRNVRVLDDFVPMLIPEEWGFHTAGTEELLPSGGIKVTRKHLEGTALADDYTLSADDAGLPAKSCSPPTELTTAEREFINLMTSSVTRARFSECSPEISRFVCLFTSRNGSDSQKVAEYMLNAVAPIMDDTFAMIRVAAVLTARPDTSAYEDGVAYISGLITDGLNSRSRDGIMTDSEYAVLIRDIPKLVRLLLPVIKADFSVTSPFGRICTFLGNFDAVASRHNHETVLSLVKTADSYYSPVSVSGAEITVDETTAEVLSVTLDGRELSAGLDYTLDIKDSSGVFVVPDKNGVYTAVVTGVGSFTGVCEKEFTARFPHIHEWVFTADGSKASVKCVSEDCEDYTTGKEYSVILNALGKTYDGSPVQPSATVSEGFPAEIETGAVVILDEAGSEVSEAAEVGKYTVHTEIRDPEDPSHKAEASLRFEISRIDMTDGTSLTFAENSADITSVYCAGRELISGTDFELSYFGDDGTEIVLPEKAGKYCARLVGKGHYTGTYRAYFEIKWEPDTMFFIAVGGGVLAVAAAFGVLLHKEKRRKKNRDAENTD